MPRGFSAKFGGYLFVRMAFLIDFCCYLQREEGFERSNARYLKGGYIIEWMRGTGHRHFMFMLL